MQPRPSQKTRRWVRHAFSSWLLCCVVGCASRATIGGFCPSGCVPRLSDASCVCDRATVEDAGGCVGASCAADAMSSLDDAGPLCSAGRQTLVRQPLDLLVVLDNGATLIVPWPALSQGFLAFAKDEPSNGIGVGLQVSGNNCDAQSYTVPLVAIATLPGNVPALQAALPIPSVNVNSTMPVLTGALQYARDWTTAHPDARMAVVLLTDANPGVCDAINSNFSAATAQIALDAYQSIPSIKTYIVGFNASVNVDSIARAGGTEVQWVSALPSVDEVLTALRKIRDDARPCAFAWPAGLALAPDSQVIDTAAGGGQQRYEIRRGSATCDHGGYYVLDETTPYPLIACPNTCAALAAGDALTLSSTCAAPTRP